MAKHDRDALADWAVTKDFVVVAPGKDQDETVRAVTAKRALGCSDIDIADLSAFRDRWFDSVGR